MNQMKRTLLTALILPLLSGMGFAKGFVVPDRPDSSVKIVDQRVRIKANNRHVNVTNRITLENLEQRPVEGEYLFPAPDDAGVQSLSMSMNGKTLEASLVRREEARNLYREIVRKHKDPAILEYAENRTYRIRIFPIPAGKQRTIRISYNYVNRDRVGMNLLHFPLHQSGYTEESTQDLSITATITSRSRIQSVYSPAHTIDRSYSKNRRKVTVGYEAEDTRPTTDFRLYYATDNRQKPIHTISHRTGTEDGYFSMVLSPDISGLSESTTPENVLFVLDTSGSMRNDQKLKQAKSALSHCLQELESDDRFNILPFGTTSNSFRGNMVDASNKHVKRAKSFVQSLSARGGTNIYDTLDRAMKLATNTSSARSAHIVLITDGKPTVGSVIKPDNIRKRLKKRRSTNTRIFTVGVGHDVDTGFLDRLASDHNGDRIYVFPEENLDQKLPAFFERIRNPVLTEVSLSIKGGQVHEVYPADMPDLFAGSKVVVHGRYRHAGPAKVELKGTHTGETVCREYRISFPEQNGQNDILPRTWAAVKIGHLLDQVRLHGEKEEVTSEIKRIGRKYGILTPYTAYMVVEEEDRDKLEDLRNNSVSSVQDRIRRSSGSRLKKNKEAALEAGSNRKAQEASRLAKQMKSRGWRKTDNTRTARSDVSQVADKTFYRSGSSSPWTDVDFDKSKETSKVEFLSERYFELIRENPDLAPYFARAQNVKVHLNGKQYHVVSND
jgi:Ca-activated chloride channel family protein